MVKSDVLREVLCNLGARDGHIAPHKWKGPLELLEEESSGAFKFQWWAIEDLNL
jgi:hypothetical protein